MKTNYLLVCLTTVLLLCFNVGFSQTSDIEFQSIQSNQTILNEGESVVVTYKVKNLGPNTATNIIITDLLPTGLVYVSDDGVGEYNSGTNIWTIPTINSNATNNLEITVLVGPGTNGTTLNINPTLSGLDQTDPNSSNDNQSLVLTINQLDLEIKKTANNNTPEVGQIIEYELEVIHLNTTTLSATNVLIEDILSSSLTYISDDSGGTFNPVTGIWNIGALITNQSKKLKILVQINQETSGIDINNIARILSFDQNDLNPNNDEASVEVSVLTADLVLTKTVDQINPDEGDTITYTLDLLNLGPSTARSILILDLLPVGLTYMSDDSGGNYNSVTGIWTLGDLNLGQNASISIDAQVDLNTAAQTITNDASVYSFEQVDDNRSDNNSAVDIMVNGADLQVVKTVNDSNPAVNDIITYTVTVTNNGPSEATNITIQDIITYSQSPLENVVLPANGGVLESFTSEYGSGFVASDLTNGVTNEDGWASTDNPAVPQEFVYSFSGGQEATLVNAVINGGLAEGLYYSKDVEVWTSADGTNYTIAASGTLTNSNNSEITLDLGNTNAKKVKLVITSGYRSDNWELAEFIVNGIVAPPLVYQSSTITQGTAYNSGTGQWFVDDLNAGASATLTINTQVGASANGQLISNTASVLSVVEDDSITANNSDTADIIVGSADIEVIKTVSQPTINSGDFFIYSIVVKNNSLTIDAFATTVTDLLPIGISYVSDNSSGAYDPGTGIWNVGTLLLNSSNTLIITCSVNANTEGLTIINTATATSITKDINLTNNTDSVAVSVNGSDLEISLIVNDTNPTELDVISYTITFTNNGPIDAMSIQVDATLPFGLGWVSDTPSQGSYDYLTGIWDVGSILDSGTATLVIDAEVRLPGTIEYEVSILSSDQSDGTTFNNSDKVNIYTSKTFLVGSAIIDMGVTSQTYNSGLIPYGLIYDLSINNKIPVYWSVSNNKSWVNPSAKQDQIDMTVDGKDYKGGPFVIPQEFMVLAQPIIDSWVDDYSGLTVDISSTNFVAPIYDIITSFPRAVLDKQNGDKVQKAFYEQAMVPLLFGRIGTPDDLTSCDDMFTMPHADPQYWSTSTVNNLVSFIQQGGYFWAACHAVSAMEGAVDIDNDGNPELNLLSNNGLVLWGNHNDGTPPYNYNLVNGILNGGETAGDPLLQFIGTTDGAWQNGSEQIFIPETEGWRNTTVLAITDEDHPEVIDGTYPPGPATALAYGYAFGNDDYGMIMYEASHTIAGGTEAENVASARIYGNFLLQAGIERRPQIEMATIPISITTEDDFVAVVSVTGIAAPFTYEWTDTCGGTFSDPVATSVTYYPNPNIIDGERCYITFNVRDNCGRTNFRSFSVLIQKDTDKDGIPNPDDFDDDNDGILDTVENNGDPSRDSDGDGVYDRLDLDADGDGILDIVEGGLTPAQILSLDSDSDGFIDLSNSFGTNGFVDSLETTPESGVANYVNVNSDSDVNYDFQDIDADNDGIPDNIELQSTLGYIAPDATVNEFGINNAYIGGIGLTYSDIDAVPDYLDTNSDNDGLNDIEENGMIDFLNNIDTDGDGLDDAFEGVTVNDPFDVNDNIDDPASSILPDSDSNLYSGGDLDFRDSNIAFPPLRAHIDFDGVDDYTEMTPSALDGLNDFTLMFWLKYNGPSFNNNDKVFVMGQPGVFEVTLEKPVGVNPKQALKYELFAAAGQKANITMDFDATNWTHFTLTATRNLVEGKTYLSLYRNGYLDINNTKNFNQELQANANTLTMGAFAGFLNFTGWMDEFRIFDIPLTQDQIQQLVYQEIQNNSGFVRGEAIPKDIIDFDSGVKIPWTNLITHYKMNNITAGATSYLEDDSSYNNRSSLWFINSFLHQTAPMPFETINANKLGNWINQSMWEHGDVWDIEDLEASLDDPAESPAPWSIIHIHDNITIDTGLSGIGLIIDENKTLTVNADNVVANNWYLKLNGTIDLLGDSQLVQTEHSELAVSSFGNLVRRQEGTSNQYWYNYWSSPVGQLNITQNNTPFSMAILKDENDMDLNFSPAFNPPLTNPVTISERWLYTFKNGITYWYWSTLNTDTFIEPGTGFTMKGSGAPGVTQEYTFDGKPNNGTLTLNGIDTGGPGSDLDTTFTSYLIGNPYASAIDARSFITDNAGVIGGTILLWEQWAGNTHYLLDYQGGYGFINNLSTVRAYQYPGIEIADNNGDGDITIIDGDGIKTPTFYIPVGQGFFVEIVNDGPIEFNNTQRVFIKESDADGLDPNNGSVFMRTTDNETPSTSNASNTNDNFEIIRLEFGTSAGATRHFVLGFNENTTDGYEYGYDGGKIKNMPDEDMGTLLGDERLVLQAYSPITPEKVIDLYFNATGNLTYSLKIDELINIDLSQEIYLRDNQENVYWNLNDSPYTFTAMPGLDTERFDIVFQSGDTFSNEEFILDNMLIYNDNEEDKLYVKGLEEDINVLTITNILGQTINTYNNLSHHIVENGIKINYLSSGIYVINIETDTKKGSKKIIIN